MARVPSTSTAATWDGSGTVWFKIFESGPLAANGMPIWNDFDSPTSASFPLPPGLPNGEYLFRVEHIALQLAAMIRGAQFHVSCAQICVSGGTDDGSVDPGPKVAIPGVYGERDAGILWNLQYVSLSFWKVGMERDVDLFRNLRIRFLDQRFGQASLRGDAFATIM
jgi:hypothetical protein